MHPLKRLSTITIAMGAGAIGLLLVIGIGNLFFPRSGLAQLQGADASNDSLQNGGPLLGAGLLQGFGPIDGSGQSQGNGPLSGPLLGNMPILPAVPIGMASPIDGTNGLPPLIWLASLPPDQLLAGPLPKILLTGPVTGLVPASLPSGPTTTPDPGPQSQPTTVCVTCFIPPAPPAPTPPANNIVNCANLTCN